MFMSWVWTRLGMNPANIGIDITKKKPYFFMSEICTGVTMN